MRITALHERCDKGIALEKENMERDKQIIRAAMAHIEKSLDGM